MSIKNVNKILRNFALVAIYLLLNDSALAEEKEIFLSKFETFLGISRKMNNNDIKEQFGSPDNVDIDLGYLIYSYEKYGIEVAINFETSKVFSVDIEVRQEQRELIERKFEVSQYFLGKNIEFIIKKLGKPENIWKNQMLTYKFKHYLIFFSCFDFWELRCNEIEVAFISNISKEHLNKKF